MVKLPENYTYAYYDASNPQLIIQDDTINDSSSALARTMNSLYGASTSSTGYILYNDEPPNKSKSGTLAHAKGVIATTSSGGFWLAHSMPKFPPPFADGYSVDTSLDRYGQTLICIDMSRATIDDVCQQLSIADVDLYDSNWPSSFSSSKNCANLVGGNKLKTPTGTVSFSSSGGHKFTSYMKSKLWDDDLYEDLVAPSIGEDLYVNSWLNGDGGIYPSWCRPEHKFDVYNVVNVTLTEDVWWKSSNDHAKWAVSIKGDWVCLCDTNRMLSQRKRGGGAICMDTSDVHKVFSNMVGSYQPCES